ncbi:hypothetical protein BDW59DRAFT_167102 [Aspergillus cavernicola]|uniref:NAD(P)-binding protein n=1 Tax=Aspergillus cavernicola TaxID=176166 RepID=A0ABR4HH18_9EURO
MGRAEALKFASGGAKIIGCDINAARDTETRDLIRQQGGEMVSLCPCDLSQLDSCEMLIEDIKDEDWRKTLDMELTLAYLLTQAAWPHLKATKGSVINVASVNSWVALAPLPALAHAAAKGCVLAMTRQLAVIESLQTAPLTKDPVWSATVLNKIMLGRLGKAEDIVGVACFLASMMLRILLELIFAFMVI